MTYRSCATVVVPQPAAIIWGQCYSIRIPPLSTRRVGTLCLAKPASVNEVSVALDPGSAGYGVSFDRLCFAHFMRIRGKGDSTYCQHFTVTPMNTLVGGM